MYYAFSISGSAANFLYFGPMYLENLLLNRFRRIIIIFKHIFVSCASEKGIKFIFYAYTFGRFGTGCCVLVAAHVWMACICQCAIFSKQRMF